MDKNRDRTLRRTVIHEFRFQVIFFSLRGRIVQVSLEAEDNDLSASIETDVSPNNCLNVLIPRLVPRKRCAVTIFHVGTSNACCIKCMKKDAVAEIEFGPRGFLRH